MPRRRAWGAGQVLPPTSPGGAWSIRWREGGRRRRESGFPTRDLAQRALDAKRGDLARERVGLAPDPRAQPTLAALSAEWLKRRERTHRDWAKDRNRWATPRPWSPRGTPTSIARTWRSPTWTGWPSSLGQERASGAARWSS